MARKSRPKILEEIALSSVANLEQEKKRLWDPRHGDWIRIIRNALRMSQAELAQRAGVNQANLAHIEKGKTDPRLSTLTKIFDALSCNVLVEPRPRRPLNEVLRAKARGIAAERLRQSMGTMALENQAPDAEVFKALLEQRTDEILSRKREHIWRDSDDRKQGSRRNSRRRH
jgi:predicted DNA-binding mobile mystery protein A